MPTSQNRKIRRRESQRPASEGWRATLYDIIFEADTPSGRWFDIGLLIAILASITIVSLETVPSLRANSQTVLGFSTAEWMLTGLFTIEYVLRLSCVRSPLRYAFSFWGVIDLLSIVPSYLTLIPGSSSRSFVIIRSVRLLRVFRVLKLWRMMNEADELATAIWRARNKIVVFLGVVLVAVTISGTLMYYIEAVDPAETAAGSSAGSKLTINAVATEGTGGETPFTITAVMAENLDGSTTDSQNMFTSIPQAMYWAIVTMTTVGYGDIVPRTPVGKAISAMLILVGYSLIIVPSTFIGAEFVQQQTQSEDKQPPCSNCEAAGHHEDAEFCYRCGERY
jgi:voltage-gated potassium channel